MGAAALTLAPSAKQAQPPAPSRVKPPPRAPVGNQALLRRLQPKLTVGAIDDPLEREADHAADMVMRKEAPLASLTRAPPAVSRKCAACEAEDETSLQRKPAAPFAAGAVEAPAMVDNVLRSPGRPLDPAARAFFEPRLGHDFSEVRVHADDQAAASAQAIGASAYTVGSEIAFAAGRYRPDSPDGRHLLAHELAHVVQQGGAPVTTLRRQPEASLDDRYQAALANARQTGNWQESAELLNAFNTQDIDQRLAQLSNDEVGYLHQGALDNPSVGPDAQVAQMTAPGRPRASAPPAPAAPPAQDKPAAPAPPAAPAQPAPAPAGPGGAAAPTADQAARNRQVACVVRQGGCASSRDGGIPSADDIKNYNQQCKDKEGTQYAGPDVTPTDEECKNPPQETAPAEAKQEGWTTGEKVAVTVVAVVGTALVVGAVVTIVSGGTLAPLALALITAVTPVAEVGGGAVVGEAALGATITLEVTGAGAAAAATTLPPVVATATLGAATVPVAVAAAPAVAPAVATIAVAESSTAALATATALGIGTAVTLPSDQPQTKDDQDKQKRPCRVARYGSLLCPAGEQGHHIVADYTLRCGNRSEGVAGRNRIPGLPAFRDGPAICLQGYARTVGDEHNIAHASDAGIEALGAGGTPPGTAPIFAISGIAIAGATTARPDCAAEILQGVAQEPSLLGPTPARTTIAPASPQASKYLNCVP